MKNPKLRNESWDRFLPKYKSKNVKKSKGSYKDKGEYTPFPPQQQPSKVDLQLGINIRFVSRFYHFVVSESGEYFMKDKEKKRKTRQEKNEKQEDANNERKRKRIDVLQAPKEKEFKTDEVKKVKKKKLQKLSVDIEKLKERQ